MSGLLIQRAELGGRALADVRITAGVIEEIGRALLPMPGEPVLDARGGALLPGLCDHHIHLHALAARARSVQCGPPAVTGRDALAIALATAAADRNGWVRGVGYVDTVAGPLDAAALDRLHPGRPVRLQHRSGAMWMLNGAAVAVLGLAAGDHPGIERDARGNPTGRLWRADDWLRARLPPDGPPPLAAVGGGLARLGITSVTDATPDLDGAAIAAITRAMRAGELPQDVQLLGAPLDWRPSGEPGRPSAGPYKIVLGDSGLPDPDTLAGRIRAVHAHGRGVAVHCVTREALVLLLAAFADAGTAPGDRLEHAALVPAELIGELARRGLRVISQPGFLADRGDDFLRDVPAADHHDLYRARSLIEAGVRLALSSDAPYGPLDPWAVIAAAARRRTASGRVVGAAERITAIEALAGYLSPAADPGGPPRRIRPGSAADLVLLRVPLEQALAVSGTDLVRATLIGGVVRARGDAGRN